MENKPRKLNAREERFVDEYMMDPELNAADAAVRAGYSATTAASDAWCWVAKDRNSCPEGKRHVWDAVQRAKEERSKEAKVDALFVLRRIRGIVDADPADIIDENTGAYKRIHDWPLIWRRMLSAADVQEIWEVQESGKKEKIGEVIKYKFIDPLKALELLGKHVNVQAFKDKLQVDGQIGISIDGQDADL